MWYAVLCNILYSKFAFLQKLFLHKIDREDHVTGKNMDKITHNSRGIIEWMTTKESPNVTNPYVPISYTYLAASKQEVSILTKLVNRENSKCIGWRSAERFEGKNLKVKYKNKLQVYKIYVWY